MLNFPGVVVLTTEVTQNPRTGLWVYYFGMYRDFYEGTPIVEWSESLERYFNEGIETGGFLRAVLENDFDGALSRIAYEHHEQPIGVLRILRDMLTEGAPSKAWGSKQAVADWLDRWQCGDWSAHRGQS